jgi:gamma-glutamyltranspeptidase
MRLRWSIVSAALLLAAALSVEAAVAAAVQKELTDRGHKLQVVRRWTLGANAAISINQRNGTLGAGVDPRTEGYAWAR